MSPTYYLEEVNELLGSRRVLKANPYASRFEAMARASELASTRRTFYVCNVVDASGRVLESKRGDK